MGNIHLSRHRRARSTFLRPQSRGRITLRSASPVDPPKYSPASCRRKLDPLGLLEGALKARAPGDGDSAHFQR